MALLGQRIFFQASVHLLPRKHSVCTSHKHNLVIRSLNILPLSTSQKALSSLHVSNNRKLRFITLASVSPSPTLTSQNPETPTQYPITESTLTLRMLLALTVSASIFFAKVMEKLTLRISHSIDLNSNSLGLAGIQSLQGNLLCGAGPLCFASLSDRLSGPLNTPMTVVVAAGLSKWLDIYSGLLMIRVLLSWFPNVPWDKQPFPAIRSLCDPYLSLFRNIIPPISNTLDLSPLVAFLVLGMVGSILKTGGAGV